MGTMSDEPDLVVTSIDPSLRKTSKRELRRKLLSFLAVSLPPVPLSYVTFKAHVKSQCQTYYDSVIGEVYESLTAHWSTRCGRTEENNDVMSNIDDPITISSDEDSESEERRSGDLDSEKVDNECTYRPKETDEPCPTESAYDDSITSLASVSEEKRRHTLTDEELLAVKAEKCTKKYTRYLYEMYDLIKHIEGTTSCNICCKLKRRIQKFVSSVGNESAIIRRKVAKELRAHRVSPKGDLTEAALEKIRASILVDKLIEISMPDIVKSLEIMENNNGESSNGELGAKEPTVTKKKKSKRKSKSGGESVSEPPGKARKISLTVKNSSHPDLS